MAISAIAKAELVTLPTHQDGPYLFTCDDGASAARGVRKPLDTLVKPRMAELLDLPCDHYAHGEPGHFVVHDLRRTCRTDLGRLGVDPFVAERVLGHAVGKVQATYDRYSCAREKRDAVEFQLGDPRFVFALVFAVIGLSVKALSKSDGEA